MQLNGWTAETIAATLVPYAFAEIAEWAGDPHAWGDQDARNRFVSLLGTGHGGVAMPRHVVASVAVGPDSATWGYTAADALDRVAAKLDGTPWQVSGEIKQHRKAAAILSW